MRTLAFELKAVIGFLQRGFRITTVSADDKFAPLKLLIEAMPGGPVVNLRVTNTSDFFVKKGGCHNRG